MKDISDDILHTINDIRQSLFNRIISKSELINDFLNSSYIEYLFNLSESLYVNSYKVDNLQEYYDIVKRFNDADKATTLLTLNFVFKDSTQVSSHDDYIANMLLKYYKDTLLEIKQYLLKTFDEIEDIIFYVGNMYIPPIKILSQAFGIILGTKKEEDIFNITIVSNSSKNPVNIERILSECFLDDYENNVIIEVILKDKERRFFVGDRALLKLRKAENIFELSMFSNLKEFHSVLCNEFLAVLHQSFLDVIEQLVSNIDSSIKNVNSISDDGDKPLFVYETFADGKGYIVSISANKSVFDSINKQLMDEYNLPPFFNILALKIEFVVKLGKKESKIDNINKKINYECPGTDTIRYIKSISYLSEYADDIIKTIYDVYQKLIKIEERINKYYEQVLYYAHDLSYLNNMNSIYDNLIESRFDAFLSNIINIEHCQMSFEDVMTILIYKEYISSDKLKNIIIIGGKNE